MRNCTLRYLWLVLPLALGACSDSDDDDDSPTQESVVEVAVEEPAPPLGLTVTLDQGELRGIDSSRAASWNYLGIPYAAPPVGDLRWRAPQPAAAWEGTRDASQLPDFCPQFQYFSEAYSGDEDCLYLNVFRPATDERDLPVFIWIHGGGNSAGDTGQEFEYYDGAKMANLGNLVVVTIQYRLGPLGWLFADELQTGDPLDDSGNYGILDMIAAMQWVQDNIEQFGGDAGNVTLAGQSAGAGDILALMLSDLATGLYHKTIIQSLGAWVSDTDRALEQSQDLIDDLLALEGAPETPLTNEELAEYLRSVDPETILNLANTSELLGDGYVIPAEGFELLETGEFPGKVPVLLGTTRDEAKLYTNPVGFNEYPDGSDELREAVGRYRSDAWRVTGADRLAATLRANPDMPDIYVYRFDWGSPDEQGRSPLPADFGATGGAFHGSEITFTLGNEDVFAFTDFTPIFFNESNRASREAMRDVAVAYWSQFAANSDPNGSNLPIWEPWRNGPGRFKAVSLNVDYGDNSVNVQPDPTVLSRGELYASARANLEGDILNEVLRSLNEWFGR